MTQNTFPADTVDLADYLLIRLRQLGIQSVFGVPGDYNLRLLDYVTPAGLHWVGNCNELNAAYAADGYARINGLSALITTFGVGELSAINGIAGAYSERAPIIHIVGTPPRPLQDNRVTMHHTLTDGDYRHFAAMAAHVTAAQVEVRDAETAPEKIDYALQQALVHSRPVYIEVPDDIVDVQVSAANLTTKSIALPMAVPAKHESHVLAQALERIYAAKQPLILVDGETRSLGLVDQVEKLVKLTSWPTWTTVFGKGLVNEQLPNVYGHYAADLGDPQWKAYFDSADLIIVFGPHYSDTNSQAFAAIPRPSVTISVTHGGIQVGNDIYRDVSRKFVDTLLEHLDSTRLARTAGPPMTANTADPLDPAGTITQKHFYRVVNSLLREGDLVLTETGTAAHGGRTFKLPPNTRTFGAVTWLSIGYMLPATLGAELAHRERNRGSPTRSLLFIGDGSLQMTVQELSTIIQEDLNVIIFIINNGGYTIERAIHGRRQPYNDVAVWKHPFAFNLFGYDEERSKKSTFSARTWGELDEVLKNPQIQDGTGVRMVEVYMDREDVEGALLRLMKTQISKEKQ
ncbi:pyruvate decarboxylase [Aspergillus terreus NIH2624]|uniref:Pyruvate decarboxylase n=1 Tax=Aspergillus terreus (strain NIH 2624 / FGSC A1156) TaxID=341663 RepID=Q0CHG1_ASPTN|nr:pyruvate decarboxylase [Aspergillus terreus NIH2624]EAU32265.1 pyruvate decarboxylase [Aspergillus terreus NIH2624]